MADARVMSTHSHNTGVVSPQSQYGCYLSTKSQWLMHGCCLPTITIRVLSVHSHSTGVVYPQSQYECCLLIVAIRVLSAHLVTMAATRVLSAHLVTMADTRVLSVYRATASMGWGRKTATTAPTRSWGSSRRRRRGSCWPSREEMWPASDGKFKFNCLLFVYCV